MYDSDSGVVTTALQMSNAAVFSQSTINDILALSTKAGDMKVTFADNVRPDTNGNVVAMPGAEVVTVAASNVQQFVKAPANAPVVIFQGRGGVVSTFNDGATKTSDGKVDRVVVGSGGNDVITIADAKDTKVVLGTGDSVVQAGSGVDTVSAGLGNSTIVGGKGDYAVVQLSGNAANYQVVAGTKGNAIVTDMTTNKVTDISKIQYVQTNDGSALIFAKNSVEASVANLYHAAFGRDADAGGLNFFFDAVKAGASLKQVADSFAQSAEFMTAHAGQDSTAFVQSLYQNTFGRVGEDSGVAFWVNALATGLTRADVVRSFADIGTQNLMGTAASQEAQVIGNVKIIPGII
jgi:hypothetical protein